MRRKVLILINPFGGAGAATANFEIAQPVLTAARSQIDVTVRRTERANHAFEIVRDELMPGQFDSIVTVSGDGLIHEVVNGACSRADVDDFLKSVTFGAIPGGTANALVKCLLDHTGECNGIREAAYLIARGNRTYMDLTELTMEYQPT